MGKYDAPKNRAKRHTELKKQSLERPGVKEMMTVYDLWQKSYKAEQAHQVIKDSAYTVNNSDSSDQLLFNQLKAV